MNVQTLVENRLLSPVIALNAPFTTTLSFPPMFGTRSVKTIQLSAMAGQRKVKTKCR